MAKKSITELVDLANELYEVMYFNPERFEEGGGVFVVDGSLSEALPLEDAGSCAVFFNTTDAVEIKRCKPFFDLVSAAFLLIADKSKREKLSDALSRGFPRLAQFIPCDTAFGKYVTLRELIDDGGQTALDALLMSAQQKPAYGLIDLSEVKPPKRKRATLSGFSLLDRSIGGFGAGELSVWTGTRGSGKSTILGQILLEAIDQGQKVCAYSGELPSWQFRNWTLLQAAGSRYISTQRDTFSGKEHYSVDAATEAQIDAWWRGKFYLYDNEIANANDADSILAVMELAAHRYGCTVFLCDNLMTARVSSADGDFYRGQSAFVGRLIEFAKKNGVHVHLVAHPRKTVDGRLNADDVGGSGDITNRADNVFSLARIADESAGFAAGLRVLKNRNYGVTQKVDLDFDVGCRRFYEVGGSSGKRYGWEPVQAEFSEIAVCPNIPF